MKRKAVIFIVLFGTLTFGAAYAQKAYNGREVIAIQQNSQTALSQAQNAVARLDFVGAKKAISRIMRGEGMLTQMNAPGGRPGEWKRKHQAVCLACMLGYEAAKHQNLAKLQASLKRIQTCLTLENQ